LIVVGSCETLKGRGKSEGEDEMVSQFVKLMEKKKWIYDLKEGCLEGHLFEEVWTQATAVTGSVPGSQWAGRGDLLLAKKRKLSLGDVGKENARRGFDSQLSVMAGKGVNAAAGKRQPNKKIYGQKPFKIPSMGVMNAVMNETLG